MLGSIILLALALVAKPSPSSTAMTSRTDCLAIITHPSFANTGTTWSLERLRDWHNENDTIEAYIMDVTTILADPSFQVDGPWGDGTVANPYWRDEEDPIRNPDLFNDTQAIIRNYIRYAHHDLNVNYVLLVGDEEQIPTRKLTADGYGAPADADLLTYYEHVPTHLYYACLDGTFNDDEDVDTLNEVAGWGENATYNNDHNIDEVDWEYEVAVGRITPNSPMELNNIVRKTIAYMETEANDPRLYNIALGGHYLGFGGAAQWGINFCGQLANKTCSDWDHVTYGFDNETYQCLYINANPERPEDHLAYVDDTVRSIFNQGIHVWYQCGHGSSTAWSNSGIGDSWDVPDVSTLENDFYPLVYGALPCHSGQWDAGDCLSEAFVNDEHGAFASIMNSRYGWGSYSDLHSVSHYVGREFFDACFSEGYLRLGDLLFDALQDCAWLRDQSHGAIRWACFDQNLIGDPAVDMKSLAAPRARDTAPPNISILSPTNKSYSTFNILLTFVLSEPAFWIGYCMDNQENVTISGNVTIADVPNGVHTIIVYANDTAGNLGQSDMVHFTIDTITLAIQVLSPENRTYAESSIPLNFIINKPTSWIGYAYGGRENVTISGNATLIDLSDGVHTIVVYANDTAGNMVQSSVVCFTIDTAPPIGSITIAEGATYTNSTSVTLSLYAEDAVSSIAQMRFRNDDNTTWGNWKLYDTSESWTLSPRDGTKTVLVQFSDNVGLVSPPYQDIIILDTKEPTANAGNDQTVNEDTVVMLDASVSQDENSIASYTWIFTDVTIQTLTGKNPTYTFTSPGVYVITLEATDSAGNTAIDTMTVIVLDITKPVANAGQDRTTSVRATVYFDAGDSSDNVGITSYEWDFGHRVTGTGIVTTHTYTDPGTYTVRLTVKDAAGNLATDSVSVTVLPTEASSMWILGGAVGVLGVVVTAAILWKRRK